MDRRPLPAVAEQDRNPGEDSGRAPSLLASGAPRAEKPGHPAPWKQWMAGTCQHGRSALAATLAVACGLLMVRTGVLRILPGRMNTFAQRPSMVKLTGNVLQTEAFRLPNTLPIYGSSELDRPADNRPDLFFGGPTTGFSVFPVGRGGTTCLLILQKLAAVGHAAEGKKAVVFLSPTWFAKDGVGENAVDANLTPPQLGAWLFDGTLSAPLRQRIAQRLLDYPPSLQQEPLLAVAVSCTAEPSPFHRAVFALLKPIGWAQNTLFNALEYCAILREIVLYRRTKPPAAPGPAGITAKAYWSQLAAQAEARDRAHEDGAVYSATNADVPERRRAGSIRAQPSGSRDEDFASKVVVSKEFDDLQLLVQVLQELHVHALFVSQPFNGIYRDLGGTTRRGRQVYYDKLAAVLAPSGFGLLDFSDHEEDRFFFNDANHPSATAWIYYNRGIDHFYRTRSP